MTMTIPFPDEAVLQAAEDCLNVRATLAQLAHERATRQNVPMVTATELAAYVVGDHRANDARVRDAMQAYPHLRRTYRRLQSRQAAFVVPQSRAAASAAPERLRSFQVGDIRGTIEITPSTSLPDRVFLLVRLPGNEAAIDALALLPDEDHPSFAALFDLRCRFEPPLVTEAEIMLAADDPLVAAVLDPSMSVTLIRR